MSGRQAREIPFFDGARTLGEPVCWILLKPVAPVLTSCDTVLTLCDIGVNLQHCVLMTELLDTPATSVELRLDTTPGDRRLPELREYLAGLMRVDISSLHADQPLVYRAGLRTVPGASWGSAHASALRSARTAQLCKDGQDDLLLVMTSVEVIIELPGHESLHIRPGDAALLSQARPTAFIQREHGSAWALSVPHRDMARMLPRLGSAPVMVLRRGTPMLELLKRFGQLLEADPLRGPVAQQMAARQLQDMLATILGQSRDFAAWAEEHSLAAVRLRAVQADIATHLGSGFLSLQWLAGRQGLSPRHLQRLLAAQGTSYQEALRTARLQAARALLQEPRHTGMSITAIAHACGFPEASALSRAFRQAYGMTPGDARWKPGMDMR